MSGKDEPCDADKTPVTIVTGFLGAGKTTLVNYILQGEHGKKIAVIENEFGEVNIDEELVSENLQYKEDVISMDNGCVACCVALRGAARLRVSPQPAALAGRPSQLHAARCVQTSSMLRRRWSHCAAGRAAVAAGARAALKRSEVGT